MSSKPKPLTDLQARGTLAHKLGRRADRIRQRVAVRFGIRPYRVFLTWSKWSGEERGEGASERILAKVEILPTPRITDLGAISLRSWSVGTFPEGSVRLDRISAYAYTEDQMRGLRIPMALDPTAQPVIGRDLKGPEFDEEFDEQVDFYWEVVEDGRGDDPAALKRFKLYSGPHRRPDRAEWSVVLSRTSVDEHRNGTPRVASLFER